MRCGRRAGVLLAALVGATSSAAAVEVTGNWTTPTLDHPNVVQTGTTNVFFDDLTVCAPGAGPVGAGTVNVNTGTFTIHFDPFRLFEAGFPITCSWSWSGTFAADGASFTGTATIDPFVGLPPPGVGYCQGATSVPISGTRVGAPVPCCGNGVVESGEECDLGGLQGGCCNASTCAREPAGRACESDFQICTDDVCDGDGICRHPPNSAACPAGPCVSGTCSGGTCAPAAPLPAGSFCETDTDLCTNEACDGVGACVPTAPVDCGACRDCLAHAGCQPVRPPICDEVDASSRIELVDGPTDAEDRLTWRWRKRPDATTLADLGDPRADTTYDLCTYVAALDGGENLIFPKRMAAAELCAGEPCWRTREGGFEYDDPDGAASGGIERARLRRAPRGRTRFRVDGRGVHLGLVGPLDGLPNLSVDLVARDGAGVRCWRARYGTPRIHTPTRYRAVN